MFKRLNKHLETRPGQYLTCLLAFGWIVLIGIILWFLILDVAMAICDTSMEARRHAGHYFNTIKKQYRRLRA